MALLRLFGHPVLERDGSRTSIGASPKAIALLALLVADAERPLARESLAQMLWPAAGCGDALANLRRHLHLLGKALGEPALLLTRRTAQWNSECGVTVDVVVFDTLAAGDPARAVNEYAGDLCAGIDDAALDDLRLRYRSRHETMLKTLVEIARASGDESALGKWLQRCIVHDPFDEHAVCELMALRRKHGDGAGAMREYNALAQRLRSDLGVEPAPQTTALFHEISATGGSPSTPHNLRAAGTTFVGRDRELAQVARALRQSRIVTLAGPGGVGKTRLALRCASDLLPAFPDGVWFVELEHAAGDSGIWSRLAEVLHVSGNERENDVCKQLARHRALVVLDTCEHLPDDARAVAERLTAETAVAVLATSRRRLNARGEYAIEVGALDADSAGRLFVERAVSVAPAFRVEQRHARLLGQLLESIDRLPLAIELVASRANVLTLEGMRKRLHAAMRIDETIEWSYDLLGEDSRRVLERLSVFHGWFDAADAQAICSQIPQTALRLAELADASLVSRTGEPGETRYRLLETTRTFARARLRAGGHERDAVLSHAQRFAAHADAFAGLVEADYALRIDAVAASMPDYLAALDHCAGYGWTAIALRLFEGLYRCALRKRFAPELLHAALATLDAASPDAPNARLYRLAGMFASLTGNQQLAIRHQRTAADLYEQAGDEGRLCDALSGIAVSAYNLGRYDESEGLLLRVRDASERIGDRPLFAKTLARMGSLYLAKGEFDRAFDLLAIGVARLRELGEYGQLGYALKNLAVAALYTGNFREAIARADEVLSLPGAANDMAAHAMVLCVRGSAERELGDLAAALGSQVAACAFFPHLEGTVYFVESLEDLATTFAACGEFDAAARLLGYSDEVRERIGTPVNPGLRQYYDTTIERVNAALGARAASVRRAGRSITFDEAMTLVAATAESAGRRIPR